MPTYQYACTECGHRFEQVQSFSDEALTVCPECAGRLRKVFNAVGVVFKGSGFYRTDSRKGADTVATGGEAKGEGNGNGNGNGASKPAAKSETASDGGSSASKTSSSTSSSEGSAA